MLYPKNKKEFPGIAIDKADGYRATTKDVANEPHRLNNNPRNDDM